MSLIFHKIENGEIFTRDFSPLVRNNEIRFPSSEEIAVVYGPNGTGKTSLIKAIAGDKGTKVEFSLDDVSYTNGKDTFHIINDQNNRNIISGETKDFFLGDNIKHEFELQDQIATDRKDLISTIISELKNSFGVSAASSPLFDFVVDEQLSLFIKGCANSKSKGDKYSTEMLVNILSKVSTTQIPEYDAVKLEFIKTDYASKGSIIKLIENLEESTITPNQHVHEIEENTEAINILNRFHNTQCIVCDNSGIDWKSLLASKTSNRDAAFKALDPKVKELVEHIIDLVPKEDPFNIKERLIEAIEKGDSSIISSLISDFNGYREIYYHLLTNKITELSNGSQLSTHFEEHQRLVANKPDITDEDYLYIQEIISNSMDKPLAVERDENKRLRIVLSNQEFLGKTRDELPLSTGEQNFLSLTFEFLKAKNSACPIVVIDDPVSSFDSIYKNKVVYAIVKMLHHKKRIVLTHNTDLIRLLDGQYKRCFKLYLLNNTDGEVNGFIALNNKEQEMLISIEKLLTAFREEVPKYVQNKSLFLISMIPFMRGYANIINNQALFENLTQVMHGYKTEKVDIAKAYKELFGDQNGNLPDSFEVTVDDILSKTVDGVHLLDTVKFPLLDRTLRHSFVYLFLRLMVEKSLVEKFNIDTTKHEQLGQIISEAYPDESDVEQIRNRIRLTSKKTLINEFNHFEGNLSIFQPAIDITDQALGKERTDLVTFISNL